MNTKIRFLFATLMLAAMAQAQESVKPSAGVSSNAVQEEAGEDTVTVAPDVISSGGVMSGGLISLSLKEVELNSVIRIFATLSDANIIIPDLGDAAGLVKIDVNFKNVEWKPALQAILDTQGLELYEKVPGSTVYSVRIKVADAPEPMDVKSFKLNYAAVADVMEMIKELIPERGKMSVFPARNTIVVQSTAGSLVEIQKMIEAVDLPRQQVFIEAKFMELSDSASEKLGIDWQVLGGYGAGINGIGGVASQKNSSMETTRKFYDINGDQYENVEDVTVIDTVTPPIILEKLIPTVETGVIEESATAFGAALSASDFNLVLAALRETGGTKIVSNPKIIVANEETATIHIGNKKPNVRGSTQTAGDSQSTTTYGLDTAEPYFTDGIKVEVTPTINTAENISVRIQPTLDRLDLIPFTAPDGTKFFGKSTKTINTLFSLASGQTAAIGGLTKTSDDEVERKVPILGNIPLLGRLFRYNSKVNDQAETIIFVTVGLANPENLDMETGLPEGSSLAMRHDAKLRTDRQIKAEELNVLRQHEKERVQDSVKKLQNAEQRRLQKKTTDEQPGLKPVKATDELREEYTVMVQSAEPETVPDETEAVPDETEAALAAEPEPAVVEFSEEPSPSLIPEAEPQLLPAVAAPAPVAVEPAPAQTVEPQPSPAAAEETALPAGVIVIDE
ncbi:MAG: hypothetical protein MUC65_00210 [Pontiellaceae bacterium]|jgi:type IV pilus assembly protein PilQ|nr:hypothetical protein [Pontiellaceae bacterium]